MPRTRSVGILLSTAVAWIVATSCLPTTFTESTVRADSLLQRALQDENSQRGDHGWDVVAAPATPEELAAYLGRESVYPGDTVQLFGIAADSSLTLRLYRIGWYGGAGARLVSELGTVRVPGSGACSAPFPGPAECVWPPTAAVPIPSDAVPGVYVVRYTNLRGAGRFIPLVVTPRQTGGFVVVFSFNTYQAYNSWGGASFYPRLGGGVQAPLISFLRPYSDGTLRRHFFNTDLPLVRFLERWGYAVTYVTDRQFDVDDRIGFGGRLVVFSGHSEYWSMWMRYHAEQLRAHGVGLAFFGANDVYWRVRYEGPSQGYHGDVLVCYKGSPDPLITEPAYATGRFRDFPLSWPENELIGIMFYGATNTIRSVPLRVKDTTSEFFRGTGFRVGDTTSRIGGWEGDKVINNGATPAGLSILFESPFLSDDQIYTGIMQATFYRAKSGAGVFAAGTEGWNWALDDHRPETADQRVQRFVKNLLDWYLR